jgi:hypothetical protein
MAVGSSNSLRPHGSNSCSNPKRRCEILRAPGYEILKLAIEIVSCGNGSIKVIRAQRFRRELISGNTANIAQRSLFGSMLF